MSNTAQAKALLGKKLDKSLATVVATESPEDRYFIGETLLLGVIVFILNRYAGAYVDRLGLKPAAEAHADATSVFLDKIRSKTITPADQENQDAELEAALEVIKSHGPSVDAQQAAERDLVDELIKLGVGKAQAEVAARQVSAIVRTVVGGL